MRKPEQFLDLKQIARVTGMSYRTIREWKKLGLLPRAAVDRAGSRKYWTSTQISHWWKTLDRKVANSDIDGETAE